MDALLPAASCRRPACVTGAPRQLARIVLGAIAALVASGLYILGFLNILRPVTYQLSETALTVSVAASIHRLLFIGEEHNMYAYLATGVCLLGLVCVIEPFGVRPFHHALPGPPGDAWPGADGRLRPRAGGDRRHRVRWSPRASPFQVSRARRRSRWSTPRVTLRAGSKSRGVMVAVVIAFSSLFVINDKDRAPISDNYPLFSSIALGTMACSLQLKLP